MAHERPTDDPRDILSSLTSRLPGVVRRALGRSRRVQALARDALAIAQGLFGRPRAPARRYEHHAGMAAVPGERRLRVVSVHHEADDAVTIALERPGDLAFDAGQFLTFVLPVGDEELRRSYSICSDPDDASSVRVTVKRVPGGLGSGYLHDHVRADTTLRVRGPSGHFVLSSSPPRRVVLVGGGSGATPLLSLSHVARRAGCELVFVLANRRPSAVFFRRELDELARAPGCRVLHVVEEDDGSLEGARTGRVDIDVLKDALGDDLDGLRIFLCGPEPMMDAVGAALTALGVPEDAILRERFATVREAVGDVATEAVRLTVDGQTTMVQPGRTILEAAIDAGMDLDFSCTMGGCGTCMAKLVSGEVVLDEPNCLRKTEREAGKILTCVARPKTDVEIERLG